MGSKDHHGFTVPAAATAELCANVQEVAFGSVDTILVEKNFRERNSHERLRGFCGGKGDNECIQKVIGALLEKQEHEAPKKCRAPATRRYHGGFVLCCVGGSLLFCCSSSKGILSPVSGDSGETSVS
mmetsp:Transcript_47987/g.71108  ORF Transcript_47987/g.71108 Transcript_47987/m.71108 type:complete len:127 (-) Transcript_47987:37-417(-)